MLHGLFNNSSGVFYLDARDRVTMHRGQFTFQMWVWYADQPPANDP